MNKISLIKLLEEGTPKPIDEGVKDLILGFSGDAKALESAKPGVFGAFKDVLNFAKNDKNQIVGLTAASPNKFVPLRNVDDLLYALRTNKGMAEETMGLFHQGLLKSKSTPSDILSNLAKDVVDSQKFIGTYGKLTPKEMENLLRQKGYSEPAIQTLLDSAKKSAKFKSARALGVAKRKALKTKNGGTKNLNTSTNGSGVPPAQNKTLIQKGQELINGIKINGWSWKKALAWGVGLGLTGSAIWWWLFNNDAVVPDDIPETEPKDVNSEWAPCIKELIDSKEGTLTTLEGGGIVVVHVITPEYPEGLNFTSNGRVGDIKTKKMGSWKCKGTTAVVNEGTQKISLSGLLNEQGDATTAADVKTMINLLDFPVSGSDLTTAGNLLQKYADNGKGKDFLSLYQQSGIGGGDLTKTLKYIYTSEPTSVQAKNRLKQLNAQILSGKGGVTPPVPTTGDKKGLGGIDIIWDGEKKADEKVINPIKKSRYHDCSGKDTFEFGCKSPKIKEIQKCLGMEQRYQTGNFGPLTKKALEDMSYDTSKGITVEMYNRIKSTCTDNSDVRAPRLDNAKIEPIKTNLTPKAAGINTDNLKMPNIQPVGQGNQGESIYKGLKNNFTDKTLPYIFSSGDRIKYKGDEIGEGSLGQLDQYLSTLGYQRIKEKDKDYGVKYVWAKQ